MVMTSSTGAHENASAEIIFAARIAEEHNAPAKALVAQFTLEAGHDTGIFPKAGQMTVDNLEEGVDMVTAQDIGLTTVPATPSEVGGKVILTDLLLRRNQAINFRSVGRQLGNAQARKVDEDVIGLYPGLNGGTTFGAAGAFFSAANAMGAIGRAKAELMGGDLRINAHPSTILRLSRDLNVIGGGTATELSVGFSAERLQNFWTGIRLNNVPFFEDGNIPIDGSDDAIGAIHDIDALGFLTETAWSSENERHATLRAWVMVTVSSYVAFEMDDTLGAALTYDAATPATV